MPELIAHRGMPREARENTLAAFALALAAGADGIELDVHVSADARVVVNHDPALRAAGLLTELTAAELARHNVPTLDEVCDLVGTRATLYVEAKAAYSAAPIVECLTAHTVRAAVHSFDDRVVAAIRSLAPDLPIGLLLAGSENPGAADTQELAGESDAAALVRRHAIRDLWPAYSMIDAPLVAAVHALGARVIAWTVNSADDARRLRAMGVDGLCTDDVRVLRDALR